MGILSDSKLAPLQTVDSYGGPTKNVQQLCANPKLFNKELVMNVLHDVLSWGSPIGTSLFLFFLASGGGIFFWGVSHLSLIHI